MISRDGRAEQLVVGVLEDEADVLSEPARADGLAVDADGSGRRRHDAAERQEQGRLAGAVGSHHPHPLALGDVEAHAPEHLDALAVGYLEAAHLEVRPRPGS